MKCSMIKSKSATAAITASVAKPIIAFIVVKVVMNSRLIVIIVIDSPFLLRESLLNFDLSFQEDFRDSFQWQSLIMKFF